MPARQIAAAGQKTWLYRFMRVPSFMNLPFLGSFHGADLNFTFNNPPGPGFKDGEDKLSQAMIGYWTRFAATGDPNGASAVAWPAYDRTGGKYLELDLSIKAGGAHKQTKCDFWDGTGV